MSDTPNRPEARLKPNLLQSASHFMHQYVAKVPNDTLLDDILTPAYWAHHWQAFSTTDGKATPVLGGTVHVMREDMSLDVILRVVGVGKGYVQMRPIFKHVDDSGIAKRAAAAASDAAPDMPKLPEGYKDFYLPRGQNTGYGIRLVSTGDTIVQGKASKREAIEAAIAHFTVASQKPAA